MRTSRSSLRSTMPVHLACLPVFVFVACLVAVVPAAAYPAMGGSESNGASGDCDSLDDVGAKEACYAGWDDASIRTCEEMRVFACKPYKDMHAAREQLAGAMTELISRSHVRYQSYEGSDPAYVDDLVAYIHSADETWRAWRDAACALEPFLDGMARRESWDLTEACRAELTFKRISDVKDQLSRIDQPEE